MIRPGEVVGTVVEVVAAIALVTLLGRAGFKRRRVRGMVGAGTAGAVYGLLNEDTRRAIELIVEQRTADRDPETAAGSPDDRDRPGGPPERRVE